MTTAAAILRREGYLVHLEESGAATAHVYGREVAPGISQSARVLRFGACTSEWVEDAGLTSCELCGARLSLADVAATD